MGINNWLAITVTLVLGGTALAAPKTAPKTFSYGCGSGCGVEASLVGSVEMVADGIKRGAFQQQILTNGQKSGAPQQVYAWGECFNKKVAFSPSKTFPATNGWKSLNQKDWSANYTPAAGGRGYYYDVLCGR
ncbi:hypothetical protein GlitD10_0559 [Gloeomargarita lithophora Alchichica-D10]|uniref:Uncharacterized protein n=1 Tax=Gloeomargarita lithophora Alchichica-D10 TaxID=1188229 RepID=A0A1J0AAE4_9CYAN|nr:hypothetical protein [Gloeomargarita lithophora]APB32873.1 hypothetical protein GlitD10_0559 [Gloeomargarita lithophora Alchichica-D10]